MELVVMVAETLVECVVELLARMKGKKRNPHK